MSNRPKIELLSLDQGRELDQLSRVVADHRVLSGVLGAAGVGAMVLNRHRQILYANDDMLELIGVETLSRVMGRLPGEALSCVNAGSGGCGDRPDCDGCSARSTISACLETGTSSVSDCVLTVEREQGQETLEFRLKASPMTLEGELLLVVTLRDISAQRRREALERVFFHDILNTITGLYGHVRLLEEEPSALDAPEIAARIARICARLRREVQDQRALLEAERGNLRVEMRSLPPAEIMDQVASFFAGHVEVTGKDLQVSCAADAPELVTDPALLVRVLINMVKNAFEATDPGGVVRLSCRCEDGRCVLSVWNAGAIAEPVASQIFRRSFSTKGAPGRGLGTYSMKLFGERYLGGEVDFVTEQDPPGTVFRISLPLEPAGPGPRDP